MKFSSPIFKSKSRPRRALLATQFFGQRRSPAIATLWVSLLAIALSWGLISCSDRLEPPQLSAAQPPPPTVTAGKLSEVAPPAALQELGQNLDRYQPQVKILSPQADQTLSDTTVAVRLQVQDLPIFKDPELGLGPHLHLFLDNEPYRAVYSTDQPTILEGLTPGTHTLRVFASRPWHESFKNEGAYAQTTFHVLTATKANTPSPDQPLLTYSRPAGDYGAEPILLDFYLTNAPLHVLARANPEDEIPDWQIRATINGQSFLLDTWQPIYLKGFEKGKNWIQLELLDQAGNPVENAFNNTVRLITYNPGGQDTLAKLVRGNLSAAAARGIVEPGYKAKFIPTPTPSLTPTPEATPVIEGTPAVETEIPAAEETPSTAVPPPGEETSAAALEKPSETTATEPATWPEDLSQPPTSEPEDGGS